MILLHLFETCGCGSNVATKGLNQHNKIIPWFIYIVYVLISKEIRFSLIILLYYLESNKKVNRLQSVQISSYDQSHACDLVDSIPDFNATALQYQYYLNPNKLGNNITFIQ